MAFKSVQITETPYVKYPRSVAFIISNEFCERFNYYGMKTILVLYLTRRLGYDDDMATILFHIFTSLVYFFPLIGAIIADSYLGRFKTILYLSIVYAIGAVIISIGAIPVLQLPSKTVTVIGLLLIATGTGGIKPCVSAFGGDQFKIPEQATQLASFFSLFYFAINAGSLVSTSITPILREDVHCFGENDCFSLAFGVPAVLMVVSIFVFICGKKLYIIKKPAGNMMLSVAKCIVDAISNRFKKDDTLVKREHWLDYAEEKYGKQLITDTKSLFKILVLYLPLPLFWALFDQQGSRWTFQATRMIGDIGGGFDIKPDQIQVINPLLILLFIPAFDYAMYPMLAKIGIKRPLQKITIGGLLAAVAFILSGFIEMKLESTDTRKPFDGESQLRIFNGLPCDYEFITNIPQHESFKLESLGVFEDKYIELSETKNFVFESSPNDQTNCPNISGQFTLKPKEAISYFLNSQGTNMIEYVDKVSKQKSGVPLVRVLANVPNNVGRLQMTNHDHDITINGSQLQEYPTGNYYLQYGKMLVGNVELKQGGVYTFIIEGDELKGYSLNNYIVNQPNSLHMLWQLPQYIVITAAEVMFSVTGLEFSYTQAPSRMKSVLQACWLLTVAFGNLLVVLIAEFIKFNSQAFEFFCFAGLMIIDMIIFALLALKYTYVVTPDYAESEETDTNSSSKKTVQTTDIDGHTNRAFSNDS